jgi:hypothetical protein
LDLLSASLPATIAWRALGFREFHANVVRLNWIMRRAGVALGPKPLQVSGASEPLKPWLCHRVGGLRCDGVPISPRLEKPILVLVKPTGRVIPVQANQHIQMILRDGILERMSIPLRNAKRDGEPLVPATLIPPA